MRISNVRRFSGEDFNRLATIRHPKYMAQLKHVARNARKRGFNARVVKNKHSSSVYVKRKYNAPIPETDPLRAALFPVALERASRMRGRGPPPDLSIRNESRRMREQLANIQNPDKRKEYANILESQLQEIKEFYANLETKPAAQRIFEELTVQSRTNQFDVNQAPRENDMVTNFELGMSNLDEGQWEFIQDIMQTRYGTFDLLNQQVDDFTAKVLGEHAYINLDYKERFGDIDQNYSFSRNENGLWNLYDEDGVIMRVYDDDFIEAARSRSQERLLELWRRQFVLSMRYDGVSEHTVLAGLLTQDENERVFQERLKLDYEKWDSWDADFELQDSIEVPAMIDLPPPLMKIQDESNEALSNNRKATIERITIDVDDVREVLNIMGWDKKETSNNGFSSLTEERQGKPNFVQRDIEEDVPPGYIRVKSYIRRLPTYSKVRAGTKEYTDWMLQSKSIPKEYFEPKSWTVPKRNRRAREELIRLFWNNQRMGNDPLNTNEILDHLNARYRSSYTTNQLGNILSKDKRFVKVGNERVQTITRSGAYEVATWDLAPLEVVL